jgi:hypothetical protein
MSADFLEPVGDPGDDPAAIFELLLESHRSQFRAEYDQALDAAHDLARFTQVRSLLRQWRLRAMAYNRPGYEEAVQDARKDRRRSGADTPHADPAPGPDPDRRYPPAQNSPLARAMATVLCLALTGWAVAGCDGHSAASGDGSSPPPAATFTPAVVGLGIGGVTGAHSAQTSCPADTDEVSAIQTAAAISA